MHELGIFGEPQHLPRLGERPAERLFASDADELRPSGLHQAMDLASMVSSQAKFGTPIHTASTSPEFSIASSDGNDECPKAYTTVDKDADESRRQELFRKVVIVGRD